MNQKARKTESPEALRQQLCERAVQLALVLRSRSLEIEAARRLPDDLAQELMQRGFCRMLVPARYGGLQAPANAMTAVLKELAQADAATAWCAMIACTTGLVSGWMSEAAAERVRPGAEDVLLAGVAAPQGRLEAIADGRYALSGRWPFGSATHNASWVVGGCVVVRDGEPVLDANGRTVAPTAIMPVADLELLDNWHVSGLKGTGSGDFVVREGVECTEEMLLNLQRPPVVDEQLYRMPFFGVLAAGVAAVAIGIAQDALAVFKTLAVQHKRARASRPLAEKSAVQAEVSRAEGRVRAAEAWLEQTLEDCWRAAGEGSVAVDSRLNLRLACRQAVLASVDAVDAAYTQAGSAAIYDDSPLQRALRNVHVITQHAMVSPPQDEVMGRLLMGLKANTALL